MKLYIKGDYYVSVDDMIFCTENPKETTKILLELMSSSRLKDTTKIIKILSYLGSFSQSLSYFGPFSQQFISETATTPQLGFLFPFLILGVYPPKDTRMGSASPDDHQKPHAL